MGKKNKKNHLFKEVIVEDEAEDLRGSQMGNNMMGDQMTLMSNGFSSVNNYTVGQSAMGKSNQTLGKKASSGFGAA